MQDILGVPIVLVAFALPDDNTHEPSEKYRILNPYRGIETLIHYSSVLAAPAPGQS